MNDAPLVHLATTTSTQSDVRAALAADPRLAPGYTVRADHQTAGRGRLGRTWLDAGTALLWSTWVPSCLDAERAPLTSLVAGLALAEAVEPWLAAALKWPNDLLAPDGRKLAGILLEGVWRDDRYAGAVVGVGLNLRWPAGPRPDHLTGAAALTEFADLAPHDDTAILARWRMAMDAWMRVVAADGRAAFAGAYNARLRPEARLVRVETVESAGGVGYIEGIEASGALRLRRPDGSVFRTTVGELALADRPTGDA